MATIRKVQSKHGHAYVAIITSKGLALKSKTFARKTGAKAWVTRIEGNKEELESLGLRGGCASFVDLVDDYIMQREGKSVAALHARAAYCKSVFEWLKLSDVTPTIFGTRSKPLPPGKSCVRTGAAKAREG